MKDEHLALPFHWNACAHSLGYATKLTEIMVTPLSITALKMCMQLNGVKESVFWKSLIKRVWTQSLLVGNLCCMTSMSLATEPRAPQSRRCDHFRRHKNKHSGVSRVQKDCHSLASVSCLAGRKPYLNTVGNDETARATRPAWENF